MRLELFIQNPLERGANVSWLSFIKTKNFSAGTTIINSCIKTTFEISFSFIDNAIKREK